MSEEAFSQRFPRNWIASEIEGIRVSRRCGLHAWEQHPQRPNVLVVSVKLYGEYPVKGAGFIDYDAVRNYLLTWPDLPHTDTIEEIAGELFDVAFLDAAVFACWIKLSKPLIFGEAQGAGIEVFRYRD